MTIKNSKKEKLKSEDLIEKIDESTLSSIKKLKSKEEENLDIISNEENNLKETNKESNDYEKEIAILREGKLRILAEMENLRKRAEREKVETIKFGSMNLARDILSPSDNLARALANIPDEKIKSEPIKNLIDGLKMVQKEFMKILEKHGVKKINALDTKFNHNLHQAMFEVETVDKEEGIVVQEVQTGYTMLDRLLRPTMVGVSKKPIKDKKKA